MGNLHLPLNSAVNLKLLLKNKVFFFKKKVTLMMSNTASAVISAVLILQKGPLFPKKPIG